MHSEDKSVVLMPVGWDTHAAPQMGARPQALINKVLDGCDLLVAVFWTRIGSPSGKSPSGTVEEIEEHLRVKKPTMIYFPMHPLDLTALTMSSIVRFASFEPIAKTAA